jgi:hypothetical protein
MIAAGANKESCLVIFYMQLFGSATESKMEAKDIGMPASKQEMGSSWGFGVRI